MDKLAKYLEAGEGSSLAFKPYGKKFKKNLLPTVCAFANNKGGSILLGIPDDDSAMGIKPDSVDEIEQSIIKAVNDPEQFNSAPKLDFEHLQTEDGNVVLRIWVAMTPELYTFKDVVYDRVGDTDVKVESEEEQRSMRMKKQSCYSETVLCPWVTEDDLDPDALFIVRAEIKAWDKDHPWLALSDRKLLRAAGLCPRDHATGKRAFNLAAVMLLGKEETIREVAPAYRTDVVLNLSDSDDFDMRLESKKNLVMAYNDISSFCRKYLPEARERDEKGRTIHVRDGIIRELVANCLIHRDFTSPYIASVTIDRESLHVRNPNKHLFAEKLIPGAIDPVVKNPIIANVFTQMHRSAELGSGLQKLYKYSEIYTGTEPKIDDGDFFDVWISTPDVGAYREMKAKKHEEKRAQKRADKMNGKIRATKSERTAAQVESTVLRLLEDRHDVPASMVAGELAELGERTVRRYLAQMVSEGTLCTEKRGRSTVYWKPEE